MTRYAVGDLQGCIQPLQELLAQVNFCVDHDELWLVGDLINRGPQSLDALRFIYSLGHSAKVVLGNHDLHFLAVAMGSTTARKQDTLDDLLKADDRDQLIHWLRQQPLLYTDPSGDFSMVHAGIPPQWTLQEARIRAFEVEELLTSDALLDFLDNMYGNTPAKWSDELSSWPRFRAITNYFTRMRFCTTDGELDLENKTDNSIREDFAPWFLHPERKTKKDNIIFGHWASLEGVTDVKHIFGIDTGYVWGGELTMLNLETLETLSIKNSK